MDLDVVAEREQKAGPGLDPARGRRLVKAMRASRCKRSELARLCHVVDRQITRYRAGHPIPPGKLAIICQRCEISEHYLLHGDRPGLPPDTSEPIVVSMTDSQQTDDAGTSSTEEMLAINRIPLHRLHINLLRHLRRLPEGEQTAALDRVINNRWAGPMEPFRGGQPVLDGVPLDRYEIAAVLALRAIQDVGREVSLINHLLSTRPGGDR